MLTLKIDRAELENLAAMIYGHMTSATSCNLGLHRQGGLVVFDKHNDHAIVLAKLVSSRDCGVDRIDLTFPSSLLSAADREFLAGYFRPDKATVAKAKRMLAILARERGVDLPPLAASLEVFLAGDMEADPSSVLEAFALFLRRRKEISGALHVSKSLDVIAEGLRDE